MVGTTNKRPATVLDTTGRSLRVVIRVTFRFGEPAFKERRALVTKGEFGACPELAAHPCARRSISAAGFATAID